MSVQIVDLWPSDIEENDEIAPVAVLREQASLLRKRTKGLLTGAVETVAIDQHFLHSFRIVVPALNDYTYELFSVINGIDLYPATIRSEGSEKEVSSPNELQERMGEVLSSKQTRKILTALLAQVKAS